MVHRGADNHVTLADGEVEWVRGGTPGRHEDHPPDAPGAQMRLALLGRELHQLGMPARPAAAPGAGRPGRGRRVD